MAAKVKNIQKDTTQHRKKINDQKPVQLREALKNYTKSFANQNH